MKHRFDATVLVGAAALGVLGLGVARARADGVPKTAALSYAGVIEDAGGPVNGTRRVRVAMFDTTNAGRVVCERSEQAVEVRRGYFKVALPDACSAAVAQSADLWVEVTVNGVPTARVKMNAAPYAAVAAHAVNTKELRGFASLKEMGGSARALIGTSSVDLDSVQAYWQVESTTCVTDGAGMCTLSFPKPFPHGLITVVVANGASANGGALGTWSYTASSAVVRTGVASGTVRVNYMALGW